MKRLAVVLLLILGGWLRADLASEIKAALADKLLAKADVGVELVQLSASGPPVVLYRSNATTPLLPASNLKLLTTAAALDKLGESFTFHTYLVLHEGNLVIWGDGDPTLGDAEMLRKVGWDVTTVFKNWAELLAKHGTKSVKNVTVDDSVFDTVFLHPHWPVDQEHKRYVAQLGGVNLNANCVDFYVRPNGGGQLVSYTINPSTSYVTVKNSCAGGNQNAVWLSRQAGGNQIILRGETNASSEVPASVTVHDPPLFAATVLAETLRGEGIEVTGQVSRDRTDRAQYTKAAETDKAAWTILAVHETPLSLVINRANKDSMNLYAEALCKRLGQQVSKEPGSWPNGTAAVAAFLSGLGVEEGQFQLDDGSGLSRGNAISPDAIVRMLSHMAQSPAFKTYLASLSVAGQDGTLQDRFRNTDLTGRVFGKSGFISGVSALSGYLQGKNGQWYAFSILINGIPAGTNSGAKVIQERIVRALDNHAGK